MINWLADADFKCWNSISLLLAYCAANENSVAAHILCKLNVSSEEVLMAWGWPVTLSGPKIKDDLA